MQPPTGPENASEPESGHRLRHYEILAPLGVGGIGQIYRARDSMLERAVAVRMSSER